MWRRPLHLRRRCGGVAGDVHGPLALREWAVPGRARRMLSRVVRCPSRRRARRSPRSGGCGASPRAPRFPRAVVARVADGGDVLEDRELALAAVHRGESGGRRGQEWARSTLRQRGVWRSLVSALVWGTRGPEFKSRHPDSKRSVSKRHGRGGPPTRLPVPLVRDLALLWLVARWRRMFDRLHPEDRRDRQSVAASVLSADAIPGDRAESGGEASPRASLRHAPGTTRRNGGRE